MTTSRHQHPSGTSLTVFRDGIEHQISMRLASEGLQIFVSDPDGVASMIVPTERLLTITADTDPAGTRAWQIDHPVMDIMAGTSEERTADLARAREGARYAGRCSCSMSETLAAAGEGWRAGNIDAAAFAEDFAKGLTR